MRPLQVPTTPIIDNNGRLTSEWLIFINELNRAIERINKDKLERGIWYNKLLS